jgi:hypothetical protein
VGDAVAKAKDAVTAAGTNGTQEAEHASEDAPENASASEPSEAPAVDERVATPSEQVESSTVELQTPNNLEEQTIR